jgi:hypothetical protein
MPEVFDPNIDVTLGGKTWTLRPSFGALLRIEQALDAGVGALMLRIVNGKAGVTEITRILYEGIVAAEGNRAPEYEEVGAAVVREGMEAVMPAALDLLTAAFRGFEKFAADKTESSAPKEAGEEDPTAPRGTSLGAPSSAPPS